ncbi:MAG: phage portal protein [Pseudomonadota bacterium]
MGFIERALSVFWRADQPVAHQRSFDAALGGRRWASTPTFGSTASEVAAAAPLVRSRARKLANDNAWLRNATQNWVGALVGTGHRPIARTDDAAMRETLSTAFENWGEDCDSSGRRDWSGIQADLARHLVVDGEGLALLEDSPDGLRVRVIPPEHLDESKTTQLSGGHVIVNGVELDARSRPVAYWILPNHPTDLLATGRESVRVDAANVIHIFDPLGSGQIRGLSWLAPAALPAADLDKLTDALLMSAQVAALHAGWVTDPSQMGAAPFEGDGSTLDLSMEPGTVRLLPPGCDVKFSSPESMADAPAFVRLHLQQLAAALGLPEHLLSGDLRMANFSSLRASLIIFRQRVEQVQRTVLTPQLFRPVWRRWIATEILADRLDIDADTRADWLGPKVPHVDPLKDLEATEKALELGLTSRSAAITETGRSPAEVDQEIAADREREAALNLNFGDVENDN